MAKTAWTARVTPLLIVAVIIATACGGDQHADPAATPAGVSKTGPGGQYEVVESLIKRYVEQPGGRHVAVEIDADVLEGLLQRPGDDEIISAFRDPLRAAELFATHIGLPEDAGFAILEVSQQPEVGSGLFIAVVQVEGSDRALQMRMVSEPDADDQPTLWMLNDYHR